MPPLQTKSKRQSTTTCPRGELFQLRMSSMEAAPKVDAKWVRTPSADYDTTHPIETRKYLKTYGLTPPGVDSFETQSKRCESELSEADSIAFYTDTSKAWPS